MLIAVGLANAELGGKSGKDLITALAAGYEFECRLAEDCSRSLPIQTKAARRPEGSPQRAASLSQRALIRRRRSGLRLCFLSSPVGKDVDRESIEGQVEDPCQRDEGVRRDGVDSLGLRAGLVPRAPC